MIFDKPIMILKEDENGIYNKLQGLHAQVNTATSKDTVTGNSERFKVTLNFTVRYCNIVGKIIKNVETYHILYNNVEYYITGYDDFMQQHRTVKLVGVSLGI